MHAKLICYRLGDIINKIESKNKVDIKNKNSKRKE
jgi:hypothetical protein